MAGHHKLKVAGIVSPIQSRTHADPPPMSGTDQGTACPAEIPYGGKSSALAGSSEEPSSSANAADRQHRARRG